MISPDNIEEYFGLKTRHGSWIVEAIWGHRLEAQPPSVLMLEFLGMAESQHRLGKLLLPTAPGQNLEYVANRSIQLRNILFNNPRMDEILRSAQGSDPDGWNAWLAEMERSAALDEGAPRRFSYVRDRFDTFAEFVSVVRLLRNITLDPGTDRSWTTQFIFPIGPAALYEALIEKRGGFEMGHVLFTRTGELAYLMLTRASHGAREQIRSRLSLLFDADSARNRLVMRLIEAPVPDQGQKKGGTYLPYRHHPAFDRMAEDVAAILRLRLPDQDALQYLQPILGFHLYLYGLETANGWLERPGLPWIVCEILAPRSDLVRRAAVGSYLENGALGARAVHRYVDAVGLAHADLEAKLSDPALDDQAKIVLLNEHVAQKLARTRPNPDGDPLAFKDELHSFAAKEYQTGPGAALQRLAAGCGLVSRRGTNRYRYAPTDELLCALVLANVTVPTEESAFLRRLAERYHLVFGPNEARDALSPAQFDNADFQRNRDRFTQHLVGMGLAHRMSDACTYVHNPMESRDESPG